MATITLKSNAYDGRYMQLKCTSASNGSAKNSSTVTWTLTTAGGSVGNYSTGPTKVIINGVTVYSESRVSYTNNKFPAIKGSKSGSLEIAHNNEGKKSITVKFSTAIYTSTVTEYSDTFVLDDIPRYGTVAHSLKSKTETTAVMNWSSDSTVDYLWYSKDNGANWTGVNVADGKSGTYTVTGLKANATYKIKTRIRRKDSQLTTDSGALSVTTYQYPRCIEAPDFVLGDAVTLKFDNPLKKTFNFSIIAENNDVVHTWTISGTEYTGVSGEPALTNLYNSIPNQKKARYTVVVPNEIGSIEKVGGFYSVAESRCAPTFSSFTYQDRNDAVTAVTGNNKVLVQGLSALSAVIRPEDKMVAVKGATASKYVVTIDTETQTMPYADSAVTGQFNAISSSGTKRLNVRAYDSRGCSTLAYQDIEVIPYGKPVVNVTLTRKNNFENETTLSVKGTYSPVVISGVEKNGVIGLSYRYRQSGGEWLGNGGFNFTAVNGEYVCQDTSFDLDNNQAYEFEVTVTDKFYQATTATATVNVGVPIFFISSKDKKCYVNGQEVATTAMVQTAANDVPTFAEIIDRVYPAGTVFMTNTNTNPVNILGRGEWTLIDKGFLSVNTNAAGTSYFKPASGVTNNGTYITRAGHSLTVKQDLIVNQTMDDTGITLGTFVWGAIGVTSLPQSVNDIVTFADGANGGISYSITADTGELKQLDVVDCDTIATGKSFHVSFTMTIDKAYMPDMACDKFYWKRTS